MSETLSPPPGTAPAAPGEGAAPARLRLGHVPALDGLRGVAIVGMLLYHAKLSKGSWLSLSTFFTLSGFLITGLLITERHGSGGNDLGSFWSRRARRLVPGALVALTLTALLAWVMGWIVDSTRGDFLSSAFWVANWRFIFADRSYAELFADPSPVQHFWSLAVEEQFYLVFPLTLVVAARWGRRGITTALVAMVACSVAITLLFELGFDRAYYGTDVRAAEFALGGLLALWLWRDDRPGILRPHPRLATAVTIGGAVALGLGAIAWWRIGPDVWWADRGGLAVYALVITLPVIAAATLSTGPTSKALRWAPLVWLGTISYGLYLYHWPIFLLLTPDRVGVDGWLLFALRLALTIGVALASYHLLEEPIRRGRALGDARVARRAWIGAALVTVIVVFAVTTDPGRPEVDFEAAQETLAAPRAAPSTVDPEAPRIAVFGDSTAVTASTGILERSLEGEDAVYVDGSSFLGCGLVWGGDRRSGPDEGPYPDECYRWNREWQEAVAEHEPDVAVVMIGTWDAYDRTLPDDVAATVPGYDGEWLAPGDRPFDRWYLDNLLGAMDMFAEAGVLTVWATIPPSLAPDGSDPISVRGQAGEPERIERLNELIRDAAAARQGQVEVLEWREWLESTGQDSRLRPDGVHLSNDTSSEAAEWILPEVVELHREAAEG